MSWKQASSATEIMQMICQTVTKPSQDQGNTKK